MEKAINILVVMLLVSCSGMDKPAQKVVAASKTKSNMDWLIGSWQRTNNEKGKETYEYWEKTSEEAYNGIGYTLQKNDTVFKEIIEIAKLDGRWNYSVTGVNENPVLFPFTEQSASSFVCENKKNEFPKKIEYVYKENKIKATISDGVHEILFEFEKINKVY